jgi:hypothetical protein
MLEYIWMVYAKIAQNRDRWWAHVNALMNVRVP